MIDLHCHILPGLDDGPADLAGSISLARAAAAAGTRTIAATPHIREDHPFDPAVIATRVAQLNDALGAEAVEVEVVTGGEVATSKLAELEDSTLSSVSLGGGPYLLVESPYTHATDFLERSLFDLQVRGFRVILAHPERSPSFLSDVGRLEKLVARGIGCSVTAASLVGVFGRTVRRFSIAMLHEGLVHDIASDAHDPIKRTPDLAAGLRAVAGDLPGVVEHQGWFTEEAPRAILSGAALPAPPQLASGGFGRRLRRPKRPPRLTA